MTEQTKAKIAVKKSSQGTTAKPIAAKKTAVKAPVEKQAVIKTAVAKKKAASPEDKKVVTGVQKKVGATATAKVAVKKVADTKKEQAKTRKAAPAKGWVKPTPEERYRMVETAAYFIAERSNFQGDPTAFWSAAELEITTLLGE